MGLGILDITLLAISLVGTAVIGIYHGIKGLRQTSEDYLLGNRMMKPLPLAMSLTVGALSAITIMGNAGEMYAHGTQLWLMDFGLALGMYFVAKVFIPIFYPLKMVSLYNYMERRFNSIWLRRATALLTLGAAYLFIGFLLFPPSLFLESFTGLSITTNIVITGLVCSCYSSFGGVKAVVYTDVFQSLIMVAGSMAIVIQGAMNVGGLGKAWDIAYHHDRIEFFNFDLDPYQRHSFWLVLIYGFFFGLSSFGANQSQTQRAFSTTSVKDAQRVIYYAIIGMLLMKGLVNLSGIVIFANYADCDPLTMGEGPPKTNIAITVSYVLQHLTKLPGLSGLFVASIYAAVLSSVSTQVNSMTALLWEDFLKALPFFSSWNDIKVARLQKVLVLATGVLGIFMSLVCSKFSSFLGALLQITGAVWGPMVGLFLTAIYLPWVKWKGAVSGFVVAVICSIWIVIGQIVTQPSPAYLPMSHESCSEYVLLINETESSVETNKSVMNRGSGLYGISYCLNYCWGVLACVIVAIFVTAVTSSNTTEGLDQKLVSPTAWRWFTIGVKRSLINQYKSYVRRKGERKPATSSHDVENDSTIGHQEELQPLRKDEVIRPFEETKSSSVFESKEKC